MLAGWLRRRASRTYRWEERLDALAGAGLLSVDLFNTVLIQLRGLDRAVLDAVGEELAGLAAREGLSCPGSTPEALLGEILARPDPQGREERLHRQDYETLFRELGAGDRAPALAGRLAEAELALHRRMTWVNPEVAAFIQAARAQGLRVVAVSDMYLGAPDLEALLARHGVTGLDRIYASGDLGRDKLHGGLYAHVLREEGLPAARVVHLGDNLWSDVLSASACGLKAIHYRPSSSPAGAPPDVARLADPAYRLGYASLGPALAVFCHLLVVQAARRGLGRLAFVSRDGDLLMKATAALLANAPFLPAVRLDYLHCSRRAVALPALERLDAEALAQAGAIKAGGPEQARLFAYFGLDPGALPPDCQGRPLGDLLGEAGFQAHVADRARGQRALLKDYLAQAGLLGRAGAALVDVGWKGTIQASLARAFAGDPDYPGLPGFYLGLWSETGQPPVPGAEGLLGDGTRSLREAAPWHLAFLFEAVCRAREGTVLGYERLGDGRVAPVLETGGPARGAERAGEDAAERVRAGILDRVAWYGRTLTPAGPFRNARFRAQAGLLRLAFFPRAWELEAVASLVHTESHAPAWSEPLLDPARPSPLTSPRRWLRGLASPWRAGYVAATGGWPLAGAFFLFEAFLARYPRTWARLRGLARRLAG